MFSNVLAYVSNMCDGKLSSLSDDVSPCADFYTGCIRNARANH